MPIFDWQVRSFEATESLEQHDHGTYFVCWMPQPRDFLNVSSNKLSTLDIVEFGSLSNLKTLMAGDNASVSSIPSSITSCKNLSRLLMRGCSLTDECKSGLKAVEEQCNAKKGRFMI